MTTPAVGQRVHHVPNQETDGTRTKPYDADVLAGTPPTLRISYVRNLDGEEYIAIREYGESTGETWTRPTGPNTHWRRQYFPSHPPTVPPSGSYVVAELTSLNPPTYTERESGTYTTENIPPP